MICAEKFLQLVMKKQIRSQTEDEKPVSQAKKEENEDCINVANWIFLETDAMRNTLCLPKYIDWFI